MPTQTGTIQRRGTFGLLKYATGSIPSTLVSPRHRRTEQRKSRYAPSTAARNPILRTLTVQFSHHIRYLTAFRHRVAVTRHSW